MRKFHTKSKIAEQRGIPEHKVRSAIDKLKLIPITWVGHTRLFDDAQRMMIDAELDRIIANKAPLRP